MTNSELYEAYLAAFTSGDGETASSYLADDFTFHGPIVQANSKQEFLSGISPDLAAMIRGYTMLQQFEKGDEVCSIYEFKLETPVRKGSVYMVERNTVRNGQLVSGRLLFDTAEFNAFMPG